MKDMATMLFLQFGVEFSISTIHRHLEYAAITLKKVIGVSPNKNSPSTIAQRVEYANWFDTIDQRILHYQDEFGVSLWSRRTFGRAGKGKRAIIKHPTSSPGKNMTVSVLVSLERGLVLYRIAEQSTTSVIFQDFMYEVSVMYLFIINYSMHFKQASERIRHQNDAIIVLDNLRSHKDAIMSPLHLLKFLPPYSPFLNPIESVFSCVKAAIKRELATRRSELAQLVEATKVMNRPLAPITREFLMDVIQKQLELVVTP